MLPARPISDAFELITIQTATPISRMKNLMMPMVSHSYSSLPPMKFHGYWLQCFPLLLPLADRGHVMNPGSSLRVKLANERLTTTPQEQAERIRQGARAESLEGDLKATADWKGQPTAAFSMAGQRLWVWITTSALETASVGLEDQFPVRQLGGSGC